jgi:hypothetical protein
MSVAKLIDPDDVLETQCNRDGCGQPFEPEDDEDDEGHPIPVLIVPVECAKGRFCSEQCRAQVMYEAQGEDGRRVLRRYYLGTQLMAENRKRVEQMAAEWDIDLDYDPEEGHHESRRAFALSPDGGVRGEEGIEDDAETAYLLEDKDRQVVWSALYDARTQARLEVIRAEQINATYLGESYKDAELSRAKKKLDEAEAALQILDSLGPVTA